jgi:hypothetical protein
VNFATGAWTEVLHGGVEHSTVGATAALLQASEVKLFRQFSDTGAAVPFVNGHSQSGNLRPARDPNALREMSRASSDTPTDGDSTLDAINGSYEARNDIKRGDVEVINVVEPRHDFYPPVSKAFHEWR